MDQTGTEKNPVRLHQTEGWYTELKASHRNHWEKRLSEQTLGTAVQSDLPRLGHKLSGSPGQRTEFHGELPLFARKVGRTAAACREVCTLQKAYRPAITGVILVLRLRAILKR